MKENSRISAYAVAGLRRQGMPLSLRKTTSETIINATCEYFNLEENAILGKGRKKVLVYPRQCAMYLLTEHTRLSLTEIAAIFGQHHTTVIYSRDLIKGRMEVHDGEVREDTNAIYYIATSDFTIISAQTHEEQTTI